MVVRLQSYRGVEIPKKTFVSLINYNKLLLLYAMQKRRLTWLKRLAAGISMTLMLAVPNLPALAQSAPPEITFSYASPTSFDPSVGQTMKIYWYLAAGNANVEIDVYDGKKALAGAKSVTLPVPMTGAMFQTLQHGMEKLVVLRLRPEPTTTM